MALHIELPVIPSRDPVHDGIRPHHGIVQLDCNAAEMRHANDYVRTPCHVTPPNSHRMLNKTVHYNAQSSGLALPVSTEQETRTAEPKETEPRLPIKLNGSSNSSATTRCGSPSGSCGGTSTWICPRCHRCRCAKCRGRRELPRSWCGTCECSAERAVDCATCMCCIRASFYHCCSDAEEDNDYLDNPCGCCDYPKCFARWFFILVVALFLPCLIFYWPCRGVLSLVTECYNDCGRGGCRCDLEHPASRPLIEAENCSA